MIKLDSVSEKKEQESDMFKPWHNYLSTVRQGIDNGQIKIPSELSDFDIAISFVTGIAYEAGYAFTTAEMIFHLLKAFTDLNIDQWEENDND